MAIQPVKKFIGRDQLLNEFDGRLQLFPSGHWRGVLYYGQRGIGKTDLRKKLNAEAARKGFVVAEWEVRDLAAARAERVLRSWRVRLQEHSRDFRFPGFDSVYQAFVEHFDPGAPAPSSDAKLLTTAEVEAGVEMVANVPAVGWFVKSAQFAKTMWHFLARRSMQSERNLADKIAAADDEEAFIELLVEQFAIDVDQWSRKHSRGAVLFLDRFEVFGATDPDAPHVAMPPWLASLLEQCPRITVVMFSQLPVTGAGQNVEVVEVPLFTEEECERYLDEAHIEAPEIRTAILDLANRMPFGLAIGVETAQKHRGPLTPDLFRNEGSLAENIYATLAQSLLRQKVLDVLSVPHVFDRDLATKVFAELKDTLKKKELEAFISNRFVEHDQKGGYSVHSLLRNAANARLREHDRPRFQQIHKILFDHYSKQRIVDAFDDATFRLIGHALYHGAWSGAEDDFAEWLHQTDRLARYAGRYSWIEQNYLATLGIPDLSDLARAELKLVLGGLRLKTKATDKENLVEQGFLAIARLRPGTARYGWALIHHGEKANSDGKVEQALNLARQARELFERLPGPNHTGRAISINNVAFYEGLLNNDIARLEGYKEAMTLGTTYSLPDSDLYQNNYAQALIAVGELDEALRLHRENAKLRERKKRFSGLAVTRSHIAEILALKGDFAAALEENAAALEMHRSMKRLRKILAGERLQVDILLQMGNHADARALIARAMHTSRRIANADEIVESLYWQGRVQLAMGEPGEAEKSVLEALGQMADKPKPRFKGELLALRAQIESTKSPAQAVEMFREAFRVRFRNVHTRCHVLSEYAAAACSAGLHEEARAALQQAVAISEVLGLASHAARLAALHAERPHANAEQVWEEPAAEWIARIDAEYDRLFRSTPLTDYEKATNRDYERSQVFGAYHDDQSYDPRFTFEPLPYLPLNDWFRLFAQLDLSRALDRLYNELIHDQLRAIHRVRTHDPDAITASTAEAYGWPEQNLLNIAANIATDKHAPVRSENRVNAAEARTRITKRLNSMGVAGKWKVLLDDNLSARLLANTRTNTISIRSSLSIPSDELDALVLHEVDTHVSRAENGARQKLSIFATGLPGYLATEEGLAVYAEFARCGGRIPKRIALRVLAAHHAKTMGFFEVFSRCVALTKDEDLSFDVVARVKRGFNDTSKPGAHLKDTIYLRGVLAVRQFLSRPDAEQAWAQLFAGKIGIEHLPAVARALQDGWLVPANVVPELPTGQIVLPVSRADEYDG